MTSFEVPVHDLSARPGSMRELTLNLVLDEPLGKGLVSVATGQTLQLELRLESVYEGILATAELAATATTECSRCLEPLEMPLRVDFQELFAYSLEAEDDFLVRDEKIDLEQAIIDAVVLNLPFKPVCSEECLGLCSECGFVMESDPSHAHEAKLDPRFSELESFRKE